MFERSLLHLCNRALGQIRLSSCAGGVDATEEDQSLALKAVLYLEIDQDEPRAANGFSDNGGHIEMRKPQRTDILDWTASRIEGQHLSKEAVQSLVSLRGTLLLQYNTIGTFCLPLLAFESAFLNPQDLQKHIKPQVMSDESQVHYLGLKSQAKIQV